MTQCNLTFRFLFLQIHEHYVKTVQAAVERQQSAAKEITEKTVDNMIPLIQMSGSSKKRKRKESEEDETDCHPTYILPGNDLHTPVPNMKKQNRWRRRGKKRQFSEGNEEYETKKTRTDGFTNNQQQPQRQQMTTSDNNKNQQQQKRWKNKRNRGKGTGNQQGGQYLNQPKKQQQQQQHNRGDQQKHEQFTPFDYSSVDYNQFRGGGQSVSGAQKPNASLKNKVLNFGSNVHFYNDSYLQRGRKQNKGKSNNRSFTFGNTQNFRQRN